ncbi:MAG: hypothetical protein J6J79_05930 [Lachnospiraceae bacterium]|nr:hypothetical protein [Lachnospiraceae bacterium]
MANITPEQKLELIRSIRMQNQYNRNQCRERERFLYGTAPVIKSELYGAEMTAAMSVNDIPYSKTDINPPAFKGFRIRFFIAILIIGIFIFCEKNSVTLFHMSMEEIASYLTFTSEVSETFNLFDL